MDRQTALAFILIGAILVIWLSLSTSNKTKYPGKQQDTSHVSRPDTFKAPDTTPKEKKIIGETRKAADSLKYGEFFHFHQIVKK